MLLTNRMQQWNKAAWTYPFIFFLASSGFSSKSSFSCSASSVFGDLDDFVLLNWTCRPSPSESECGSLWPARCDTCGSPESSPMACARLFWGDVIGVPVAVDDGLVVIDVSNDWVLDDSLESLRFIIGLLGAAWGYDWLRWAAMRKLREEEKNERETFETCAAEFLSHSRELCNTILCIWMSVQGLRSVEISR